MKPVTFLVIAVVLFCVSLWLVLSQESWQQSVGINSIAVAPNLLAGLASFGFAIAGGISLIAAAMVSRNS